MEIEVKNTTPYQDQKPGTSGLRKKVKVYSQENYLENFIEASLQALPSLEGETVVVGGDGRYFNTHAIQVMIKMLVARKVRKIIIGQNGILSTPAASNLIIKSKSKAGFILSASHNPAGLDGDFGIKVDMENGGGAPDKITNEIFEISKKLTSYKIAKMEEVSLSKLGTIKAGETEIELVDSVKDYVSYLKGIFDFDKLKMLLSSPHFRMKFDAMNGVTGPYAHRIFEEILGAPKGTVLRGTPLEDFGGAHPDPNLTYAKDLVDIMFSDKAPDFGAASDGDGDRNMILGRGVFVTPSDSLALLVAHYKDVPFYAKEGVMKGVARSMPTSAAVDKVAQDLGLNFFETPTGWKYFASLMDAGKITFCGEESFGSGCSNIREKDGIWAVLFWLSILEKEKKSVTQIVQEHWQKYGRNYYLRYDYETLEALQADNIMAHLKENFSLTEVMGEKIKSFDKWDYTDCVTGEQALSQGIRLCFENGERVVFRLSGTGSSGKTLRVYLEHEETDPNALSKDAAEILAPLVERMLNVSCLEKLSNRKYPTVIT
ncbi:MAG: alpha-D-glucose phosphate-specific phosphoglucomutase [Alphaproteobacteria bacterium]|nr:alpha-D-glucose phosphate-specific phosphoglucomutase [Alphaproteobacteria bacterium]